MFFAFNKYDDFAVDYSNKRKKPWKYFVEFLGAYFNSDNPLNKKGFGICCDMGCGSGRHTSILSYKSDVYVGLDLSFNLLKFAKKESETQYNVKTNWIACDIQNVPLRENSLTTIVSIAVLHHFIGKKNRQKIVDDLYHLLKSQGVTILSVWGYTKEQKKRGISKISTEGLNGFKIGRVWVFRINEKNKKARFLIKIFEKNTFVIPWTVNNGNGEPISTPRIYHFFNKDELLKIKGDFDVFNVNTYGDATTGPNYFVVFFKK